MTWFCYIRLERWKMILQVNSFTVPFPPSSPKQKKKKKTGVKHIFPPLLLNFDGFPSARNVAEPKRVRRRTRVDRHVEDNN